MDTAFLRCLHDEIARRGIDVVLSEVRAAIAPPRASEPPEQALAAQAERGEDVARVLEIEARSLARWDPKREPAFFLQQVRNRSFELGLRELQERAEAALAELGWGHMRERTRTDRTSAALLAVLEGHTRDVNGVALSADGALAVTVSADRTLKIWDAALGCLLRTLAGHSDAVNAVALSADGRVAVTASQDKTLGIWDPTAGRIVHVLEGHTGAVNDVALSADGRIAVSASRDRTLKIWDVASGRELHTLQGHTGTVCCAALSADGELCVSGSADRTVRIWSATTGQALHMLQGHEAAVHGIAVTVDGRILTASGDGVLGSFDLSPNNWVSLATLARMTDVDDPDEVAAALADGADGPRFVVLRREAVAGRGTRLNRVVATPDGRHAVAASEDGDILIQSRDRPLRGPRLRGHEGAVRGLAVSADGRRLASASTDGTLRIWDLARCVELPGLVELESLHETSAHGDRVDAVAITDDGKLAVSASRDRSLVLWNVATAQPLTLLVDPESAVRGAAMSADGRLVVSASADHTVKIWEPQRAARETMVPLRGSLVGLSVKRPRCVLEGHSDGVNAVALAPDGGRLVSASADRTLRVWALPDGPLLRTLEGHAYGVNAVAVTRDGELCVSGSRDRTLKIWRLSDGELVRTLEGHTDAVNAVAVTPDGALVLSGSTDRTLKIWRLSDGELVRTLEGHTGDVRGVAVTADGRFLVSVAADRTLRLWRVADGRPLATMTTHAGWTSCAVTALSTGIVAADSAGGVHMIEWVGPEPE